MAQHGPTFHAGECLAVAHRATWKYGMNGLRSKYCTVPKTRVAPCSSRWSRRIPPCPDEISFNMSWGWPPLAKRCTPSTRSEPTTLSARGGQWLIALPAAERRWLERPPGPDTSPMTCEVSPDMKPDILFGTSPIPGEGMGVYT